MVIQRSLGLFLSLIFIQDISAQALTNDQIRNSKLPTIHENEDDATALKHAIERIDIIEQKAGDLPFIILPHRPNYMMPVTYQERPHDQPFEDVVGDEWPGLKKVEAVFQVSLKYQIAKLDKDNNNRLYVAYTNKSYWQVYNSKISRPFRETNHEPELIAQFSPNWGYINRFNIALNHQSNGQYQDCLEAGIESLQVSFIFQVALFLAFSPGGAFQNPVTTIQMTQKMMTTQISINTLAMEILFFTKN